MLGENYFKKLAHANVEVGKSKFCSVGWQEEPGRGRCHISSLKAICWRNALFLRGGQTFFQ